MAKRSSSQKNLLNLMTVAQQQQIKSEEKEETEHKSKIEIAIHKRAKSKRKARGKAWRRSEQGKSHLRRQALADFMKS